MVNDILTLALQTSSSPPIMQPSSSSSSSSNYTYTKQQFIRDVLELARQRLSVESELKSKRMLNTNSVNFMEIIVGVGYMLLVLSFLVKMFLKTLRRFESHFRSSSHGNRFGFITNEDSDYESYSGSDSDLDRDDTGDEDEHGNKDNDVDSPISLRPTLTVTPVKHVAPMTTPMHSINVDTPQTPYPPAAALRRSLRLKIKSEMNLTSIEKQNQNRTDVVTRSQTQQNENITISSAPPLSYAAFRPNHNSTMTPSAHPENDEELAFILRLHYENRMKRRSRFNSPLVVRRLVL